MQEPSDSAALTLVQRAREFAVHVHRRIDQRRKYSKQPYEVHLKAVSDLVASVSDDEEMLAAAWLHDSVEDTPATLEDIEREFGASVARLVADLTDVSRPGDGNRVVRKAIDREHSAQASARAKTVKLADLIDNCRDICEHDARFARTYAAEMAALLDVLGEGDARLLEMAQATLATCADRLKLQLEPYLAAQDNAELSTVDQEMVTRHQRTVRQFIRAFTAEDIAEPLPSFDGESDARRILDDMNRRGVVVAGLRKEGLVVGYVQRQLLAEGSGYDYLRNFERDQVLDGEASLTDVVHVLTRHDYCFVCVLGDIAGMICRADMQKPFARMWLFGLITFTEMQLRERILRRWPDDAWTTQLSAGRLEKAQALQVERQRRGQECQLLDCVQFADQAQILMGEEEERLAFGFESKAATKRVIKEIESLRNNLAHAQDIVTYDWAQIARLAQRIEGIAARL